MFSNTAAASCGAAFCAINTSAEAHGEWAQSGTRADLRFEFIRLDQLRSGSAKTGLSGQPNTHDEVSTLNRNLVLTLDHSLDEHWGIGFQMPYLGRNHGHLFNDPVDGPVPENWRMTGWGDTRAVVRFQPAVGAPEMVEGIKFGVKLPTGSTQLKNAEGERAERMLQPGSGTTDLIIGAYARGEFGGNGWFGAATLQRALQPHEDFRPGRQLMLDAGISTSLGHAVSAQFQLNALLRGRDSGLQAEPEHSGSRSLFLSPGLSAMLNRQASVYGFVQLPLYQNMNGTQLTSKWAAVVGYSRTF
ncbi:MAG: hypothetical protein NT159_22045 [Proteobacteria bacterium]|nr:hypothetical protein [Pseudomonadota bacterium]